MAVKWKDDVLNWILVPVSFLMILAYNVNLYIRFKRNPMGTVMGVNLRASRAWVRTMTMDNDKKNILAVQTLRNSIMGSTILATTAIFLATGVLAYLATVFKNASSTLEESSLNSIRYINDVNFLINIPVGPGQFNPDYVADVLERGANFYTVGTRALYIAIPSLLWLFGALPFFISTVLLIPIWYWLDTAGISEAITIESCEVEI